MVLDRCAVSGRPAPVAFLCCALRSLARPGTLMLYERPHSIPASIFICSKLCTIPRIFRKQDLNIPSLVLVFPNFLCYSNEILTSCSIRQAPFLVLPSSAITLLHPTPDSLLRTKEHPSFVLQIPSPLVVGRNNVSTSGMCKYLY